MSDPQPPPKPRLKINVSRSSSFASEAAAAAAATPTESARKVKLKINASQPPTPAEGLGTALHTAAAAAAVGSTQVKTKAGRQPKPTMKIMESKKRQRDEDDGMNPLSAVRSAGGASTKIKIRPTPKGAPTSLILKPRGRPPVHPPGDGYDSEASDRERDPAIEEQFILRMLPGEHCDYVRWAMENGKFGISKSQGGANISFKFFEEETRRAVLMVKGQAFAAVMVDLPTITEAMKTWDKKSFMKSADICQMLLVYQQVKDEAEAKRAPLPGPLDTHFRWPHGLTPPMHDCVNRRFAKTISRKEIEDKEAEVERLLAEDAKHNATKWEWVDERRQQDGDYDDGDDEDAEGEVDDSVGYFNQASGYGGGEYDEDDMDLEADLEAAFADEGLVPETPATNMATPMTAAAADTPAAGGASTVQQSIEMDIFGEEEDEEEEDDDDDDEDDDLDDDERAERNEHQAVLDMIADLEKQLEKRRAELEKTTNRILRSRIEQQIKQYKSEIELKKSSIGIETDD